MGNKNQWEGSCARWLGEQQKIYKSGRSEAELSLLETFTDGKGQLVVQEYTVKSPIPVRNGTVGPIQSRTNPAEAYPGGGQQYELLLDRKITIDNGWKDFLQLKSQTVVQ